MKKWISGGRDDDGTTKAGDGAILKGIMKKGAAPRPEDPSADDAE